MKCPLGRKRGWRKELWEGPCLRGLLYFIDDSMTDEAILPLPAVGMELYVTCFPD